MRKKSIHEKIYLLSKTGIVGGMETYSRALARVLPGLRILETMNDSHTTTTSFFRRLFHEPLWGMDLVKQLSSVKEKPGIVLANGMQGWSLRTKGEGIPTLCILHGTFAGLAEMAYPKTNPLYWRMRYLYHWFERQAARNAHVCIANSCFTKEEAKKYYGVDSHIVEPPIDTKLFRPSDPKKARKKLGWSEKKRHVLFVGNPLYSKGVDIVEALARQQKEVVFHAVCIPPAESKFSNLVNENPQPHERLPLFYQASEAVLFPSRYESFGFVPLEALACHTPVLAGNVGILREFNVEGLVKIPPFLDSYAHALKQVFENPPAVRAHAPIAKRFSFSNFQKGILSAIDTAKEKARMEHK